MNFGGMPRGGGRKVIYIWFVLGWDVRFPSSLWRDCCPWAAVCAAMRERNLIHLFSCFRARVWSWSLLKDEHCSLFAAQYSKGRSGLVGVFQLALFLREREKRDKRMCFPISPTTREKEKGRPTRLSSPKRSPKERKKNQSTAKTYPRKRKSWKERERRSVFLKRKERHFFSSLSPFSLSLSLTSEGGASWKADGHFLYHHVKLTSLWTILIRFSLSLSLFYFMKWWNTLL